MTAFQPGSPAYEALIAERAELRAEIARLQELFRIDGEQHAAHVKTILHDQDTRLAAYKAEMERLRAALEAYACPGLGECREPRLDDGSCLVEASGGRCGDEARRALEPKP